MSLAELAAATNAKPRKKPEPEPAPAPAVEQAAEQIVDCLGMRLCPNRAWLYAIVGEEKVAVFAGRRLAQRLVGKPFQATVTTEDGEKQYTYHSP